jgi:hypothetical protein
MIHTRVKSVSVNTPVSILGRCGVMILCSPVAGGKERPGGNDGNGFAVGFFLDTAGIDQQDASSFLNGRKRGVTRES